VSAFGKDIGDLYFRYRSVAGHFEGCSRRGTDVWEVTRFTWDSFSGDTRETTIRLACRECGVVHFETADGPGGMETTHASQIGYASRPDKVLGVWLHPGPRIWHYDERGPVSYLVTASKEAPRSPEDVLGRIAWHLGRRGGVKWGAGAGCTDHGTVLTPAGQDFASRRAAVAWLVASTTGGAR
jgi:hypothetical protein